MPYSYPNNVPTFAKNKSANVKKVAVEVFNNTYKDTQSEEKARIASLAAMSNAEAAEKESVNKAESYTPSSAMVSAAKRGLALREKYGRGGLDASQASSEGVGSGVARARDIINGNLSLESVKRMKAFFDRHEKNYKPDEKESDGGPTAGTIAWLLWGGSSARTWANAIVNKIETNKSNVYDAEIQCVIKSSNEVLMQALYVVLIPNEEDAHGDIYDETTVRKACENFNKSNAKSNLYHLVETDAFDVIESYIAPCDITIKDHVVKSGTWLAKLQFNNKEIFKSVLAGEFSGVSIGAMANIEEIEDDN